MSAPQEPSTEGTGPGLSEPDDARSGADIAEAVEVAERGSSVQEVHDRPTENKPGAAPVEQSAGDPEMTEGQVVLGDGEGGGTPAAAIDPREAGSGGAQSAPGARMSDRRSAGQPEPEGPPFSDA